MGASGSKSAAVQKAASRAAAAAAKPAETAASASAAAPSPRAAAKISEAERQRAAALLARQQQDPAMLPAEQRTDNESLVQSMNKVMAGMSQYQYEVYRNPEVDKLYALKKKTKEEKEAQLVGRLASPALKALLEEHARGVRLGQPPAVDDLARRYGANPEVLQRFLEHNSAPVVQAARDGRFIGIWPDGRDE